MRGVMALLLIGVLLSLPAPALCKGKPLTDAELEEVAALPGSSELSEAAQDPIASVAARRSADRRPVQTFAVPYSLTVRRPDGSLDTILAVDFNFVEGGFSTQTRGIASNPMTGIPTTGALQPGIGIPISMSTPARVAQ